MIKQWIIITYQDSVPTDFIPTAESRCFCLNSTQYLSVPTNREGAAIVLVLLLLGIVFFIVIVGVGGGLINTAAAEITVA